MPRFLPVVLAVVAIVALTLIEGGMTQRWADSRHCAYCATLLESVPTQVGDWVGQDLEVDEEVQVTAGARGYVSRSYTNDQGQNVTVWLIVGHSRDTIRHTPNICYPSNGYKQTGYVQHTLALEDGEEAGFFTDIFTRTDPSFGQVKRRVYWTWFNPEADSEAPVRWIAPDSPRMEIGATPSLYKLYFTCGGPAAEKEHSESPALEFAQEFIPLINPVLAPANGPIPADFVMQAG